MSASDLVLPLAVDAGEFERRWSEAAFEKRETFGVSCVSTMDELVDKTKQELRLHPVEIIGEHFYLEFNIIWCLRISLS